MYLRVYDSRDTSRKSTPSPSLCYSLTHTHRTIGYRNQTQSLTESVTRLMYCKTSMFFHGSFNCFDILLFVTTVVCCDDPLSTELQGHCITREIWMLHLFVLHNTDTVSFPLSNSRFLRYNKQRFLDFSVIKNNNFSLVSQQTYMYSLWPWFYLLFIIN